MSTPGGPMMALEMASYLEDLAPKTSASGLEGRLRDAAKMLRFLYRSTGNYRKMADYAIDKIANGGIREKLRADMAAAWGREMEFWNTGEENNTWLS